MDQMIEIMHFTVSIFVMGVSSISSLDATQTPYHNGDTPERTTIRPRRRNSQSPLLGNAGVFQEVDVAWQLLRFSYSVQGELVWNRSKMKRVEPEFLVENSETSLFRDPEMFAEYVA
jgi:hypothetical protein